MPHETTLTTSGVIIAAPKHLITEAGVSRCEFKIAAIPQLVNHDTYEPRTGDPLFLQCVAWRDTADNAAITLVKGMRVIATGKLVATLASYDGVARHLLELHVDEIGPSLADAAYQPITSIPFDTDFDNRF